MAPRVWFGLGILCLLSSVGWLADAYLPGFLPSPTRQIVQDTSLALFCWAASRTVLRGGRKVPTPRICLRIAMYGALLFAAPAIVQKFARGHVSDLAAALVFTLVPVGIIFLTAQTRVDFGPYDVPLAPLVPALAAVGGAALLLPFRLSTSVAGILGLAAYLLATALAAVSMIRLHALLRAVDLLTAAALVGGASALTLALMPALDATFLRSLNAGTVVAEAIRCLALDGPALLLTLWLLRELKPLALSTRYLLSPLLTVAEGFALLRPPLSWTLAAGVLLLAGGSAALLRSSSHPASIDTQDGLGLR